MMLRALACLLTATLAPLANAADWPQWRGPHFNGFTNETRLPATWSNTTNVAWAAPMPGLSAATPAVWGSNVFVTAIEEESLQLWAICLDRRTGRVRWRHKVAKGFMNRRGNSAASPSPIADGKRAYFFFGTGDFVAYDVDGRQVWRRHIAKEHGEFKIMWRYGASPLLYDGKLYLAVLHSHTSARRRPGQPKPTSYLLCIDPATGKDLWKHERLTDAVGEAMEAYVTPYPFPGPNGVRLIIPGADYVTAHDPATGAEVWRSDTFNPRKQKWFRTVASAVGSDGIVFTSAARGSSMFGIKAGGQGQLSGTDRAWTIRKYAPDVCTPLAMNGRFYVLDGGHKIMTCIVPETGEIVWQQKLPVRQRLRASPTGADGKIYCISLGGEVVVLEAGDSYKVIAKIFMGEATCQSTIVAAYGQLFIRTADNLYCIGRGR